MNIEGAATSCPFAIERQIINKQTIRQMQYSKELYHET